MKHHLMTFAKGCESPKEEDGECSEDSASTLADEASSVTSSTDTRPTMTEASNKDCQGDFTKSKARKAPADTCDFAISEIAGSTENVPSRTAVG